MQGVNTSLKKLMQRAEQKLHLDSQLLELKK